MKVSTAFVADASEVTTCPAGRFVGNGRGNRPSSRRRAASVIASAPLHLDVRVRRAGKVRSIGHG
jgi:hypothetical protein